VLLRPRQAVVQVYPVPMDMAPGAAEGHFPTLGAIRRQATEGTTVMADPTGRFECTVSIAEWSDLPDETAMGITFRYSALPGWLRMLR
jgi:hypothetical protein